MVKTVRLTEDEQKAIERFLEEENMTFSDMIRDLLEFGCQELGYAYPRAKGRGHSSTLLETLKRQNVLDDAS